MLQTLPSWVHKTLKHTWWGPGSLTVVELVNNLAQTPNTGLIVLESFNNNIIASSLTGLLEEPQLNSNHFNTSHLIIKRTLK